MFKVSHALKSWPDEFEAVNSGYKRSEVRRFDRDYQVSQNILLREWDPGTELFTGRACLCRITHITSPGAWGLPEGIGVLSIELVS